MFSIVITGIAADYFGKKVCLIALSIPAVLFWTLTYVSTNVFHLYAARTVAGMKHKYYSYYHAIKINFSIIQRFLRWRSAQNRAIIHR